MVGAGRGSGGIISVGDFSCGVEGSSVAWDGGTENARYSLKKEDPYMNVQQNNRMRGLRPSAKEHLWMKSEAFFKVQSGAKREM